MRTESEVDKLCTESLALLKRIWARQQRAWAPDLRLEAVRKQATARHQRRVRKAQAQYHEVISNRAETK